MTHTSTELLPCPFCGCKPKLEGTGLIRWIKCPEDSECGSSGMAMGIAANDLSRGIAAWNRRSTASQARVPLSVVDAIKQGLQADEATRHHCRGTTNWAAAMTRFYERAHGITQENKQ